MKKHIIHSGLNVFKHTKVHKLLSPIYSGLGSILMFHRVLPEQPRLPHNKALEITPEFLEKVIIHLKSSGYQIISLDDIGNRIRTQSKKPFICFTFDDGYVDNYEIAYPLFKKHRVPFTIYVSTSYPDKTCLLWWYLIEDLLLNHSQLSFTFDNQNHTIFCHTFKQKTKAYSYLRQLILSLPKQKLLTFLQQIETDYHLSIHTYKSQTLTWEQIQELANSEFCTIGSHTINHYNLRQLNQNDAKSELLKSKQQLESIISTPVNHFAYPFGTLNEADLREFSIARECDYHTATTTREGSIFPDHINHMHSLPRINITGKLQNLTLLDMRLSGFLKIYRSGLNPVVTR
ncbi:polysaccharide deacetylase family protein [Teredinibacter sp. KSP-S5-2]|uniref:polysaccharide deacetylase family protein n=1 Tax=Teredinibacter sp. KSP-S5-2 TaxID=3034506 RepID=UPI0029349645|nr:polysaccharide deacetylase family protein [Teredinibacter sp. KSP-S5-2]WNO10650.1 polysaccharide deacetylase family protein [Teredinibacter sp. KSP-S5-2]